MKVLNSVLDILIASLFISLVMIMSLLSFKNHKNEPLFIDKEFTTIFNSFKKDAAKYKVVPHFSGLTTTFVDDIKDSILGYCIPKINTVKISKKKWDRLSELDRKLLLYHEWAHCTLYRDHTQDVGVGCPVSIMNPYITPVISCYNQFKDWYDMELFTNPNKTDLIFKENYEISYPTTSDY